MKKEEFLDREEKYSEIISEQLYQDFGVLDSGTILGCANLLGIKFKDIVEKEIASARVEVANAFKNKECYYCAYKNEKLSSSDLDVDSCIRNCEEGIYLGITNNEFIEE